jgi:hypothetical protein
LLDDEARALADELGSTLAAPFRSGCYQGELPVEELYRLTAFHEERRLSVAAEHAQTVCGLLSEVLPDATCQRLHRALPQLTALLARPTEYPMSTGAHHLRAEPAAEHTLAAGRPGSRHPLSEARPTSSQPLSEARPDLAHANSVARSDAPHAETKLSSAPGLTQERELESLARSRRSVPR